MPPLLFMGEEWGSRRPFPFFCDFKGALADAVRQGRREELKFADDGLGEKIPDPLSIETFRSAVLDWEVCNTHGGKRRLALVRDLLMTRAGIAQEFAQARFAGAWHESSVLVADWALSAGRLLRLLANLSPHRAQPACTFSPGRPLWGEYPGDQLRPWSVFWSIGDA